jgi:hypothetical protein
MITIITPATSTDLATLAAVKAELGNLASSISDIRLGDYISQASRAIVSYCNRVFAREEVEETLRVCDMQSVLTLTRCPVAAVSTIVENDEELATEDYEVEADTGMLRRLRNDERSSWRRGKIVVTYTAGFVLPGAAERDMPEDIERAAILLAVRYAWTDPDIELVRRSTTEGIGSREMFAPSPSGIPIEVEALISRYRNIAM